MADNNRADTQLLDGGGAACFTDNMKIWTLFNSIVAMTEQCEVTCPPYPPTKSGAEKVCTGEPPLDPDMDGCQCGQKLWHGSLILCMTVM